MKPIAISSCLALAALSLFAADPQATKDAPLSTHPEKLLSSPRSTTVGDSPLVRAAKSSNRLGKKPSQVITNETLVHSGGHFTTTETQTPIATAARPSEPSWDQIAADARTGRANAAAAAEQARKLERQRRLATAAEAGVVSPEGLYNDQPALESPKPLSPETMTVKPISPETMVKQKPPQ